MERVFLLHPTVVDFKGKKLIHVEIPLSRAENVTENRVELILNLIMKNEAITTNEIARTLSVTRRAVAPDMEWLKEKGWLKRIGADKGGRWEIAEHKKSEV